MPDINFPESAKEARKIVPPTRSERAHALAWEAGIPMRAAEYIIDAIMGLEHRVEALEKPSCGCDGKP